MFPFDTIEDRVTVRSLINSNEFRSILDRRKWCGDGSSAATVSNTDYLVAGTCEW